MRRYWIVAPVESENPDLFDKVWQFDLANNLISIGWTALGDVSNMSRQDLAKAVASAYPEKPAPARGLITNMMWNFYHEIVPGDLIIARRGLKILAGIGRAVRPAFYAPGKNPLIPYANCLEVSWQEEPRNKVFKKVVFPMPTVIEWPEEQFQNLLGGSTPPDGATEAAEGVEDPSAFILEKYLEEFIVSNFHAIFKGELRVYKDGEGNDGQQYATDIGPIDILAVEHKSNSFVVIELKKGRPSDQVVGQILRYMGWVKRNLCKDGQVVKGLVICQEPDSKMSYALEMTKNIDVRYYTVSFKLTEAA